MLPKWHFLLGLIFSLVVWALFPMNFFYPLIILISSVLIDVDHYIYYVIKYKDSSLKNSYSWFNNLKPKVIEIKKKSPGIKIKVSLCIFHTIEFLLIIFIIGLFSKFFMFVFIGFIFHSIVDVIDLNNRNVLNFREFSILLYLKRRKDKKWHYL